jgi:hypothetical protein
MLTRCVNCGFYVNQNDEFCLNCGIKSPTIDIFIPSPNLLVVARLTKSKLLAFILSTFMIFISLCIVTDGNLSSIPYLRDYVVFAVILFGVGISFLSLFLINKWFLRKHNFQRPKSHNNFNSKKNTIDRRLSELDKRAKTIDSILSKIAENSSTQLKELRPKLLSARGIVSGQFARYELQKQKIELARLQNSVSPYLFGLDRFNEFETENGLVTLENTLLAMNRIRQNLTRDDEIEFSGKALSEKQTFFTQLDETEDSCQKLREALLSKQAVRALQALSPIEENLKLSNSKELARESDVFNIQTTLTDFSESFDELEREYKRLKAEEETEQKLLVD